MAFVACLRAWSIERLYTVVAWCPVLYDHPSPQPMRTVENQEPGSARIHDAHSNLRIMRPVKEEPLLDMVTVHVCQGFHFGFAEFSRVFFKKRDEHT